MGWVSLTVEVDGFWAEPLSEALLEHGARAVELSDADVGTARENPLFDEPGERSETTWPRHTLIAWFDASVEAVPALTIACHAVEAPTPTRVSVESVPQHDWVKQTQDQFQAIQVSTRLWIVPTWCNAPASASIVLQVDPGIAFGTGAHPSTWQCLNWMDQQLRLGQSILDYGCGSGILAIAAKKLGAQRVVATDIDADALEVTIRNAALNRVSLKVVAPDAARGQSFDVVIANILANPLRLLAPVLSQATRSGGHIVLAGILDTQAAAVCAAYHEWFDMRTWDIRDGWVCLIGQRRAEG